MTDHPAVRAWCALHPGSPEPESVTIVSRWKRFAVYGLAGAGGAVIAKERPPVDLAVERVVYLDVLPPLPVPKLQCLGYLEEESRDVAWLFVEEAGGVEFVPSTAEHRAVAGRWLGRLHASATSVAVPALPHFGLEVYADHLAVVRGIMERTLASPLLDPGDRSLIEKAAIGCESLRSSWCMMAELCNRVPPTLVHGDLAAKNARLTGEGLLVFDWEMAGWGLPAIDLAQNALDSLTPDLHAYWTAVRGVWPHLALGDIQRLAALGSVFRILVAMRWAATAYEERDWPQTAMPEFREYYRELASATGDL